MATQTSPILSTLKWKKVTFIHIPSVEFSEISHNCRLYMESHEMNIFHKILSTNFGENPILSI